MARFSFQATVPELCHREEAFREHLRQHKESWLSQYRRKILWRRRQKKAHFQFFRLLPTVSVTLGSLLLANALWPILSYFIFTSPALQKQELVSALPDTPIVRQTESVPQAQAAEPLRPKVIRDDLDFTNLSNWFPDVGVAYAAEEVGPAVQEYTLNIPSLKIENALVKVGGTNLDDNLIQYPGTAEPGKNGAPVIFGHSVLRQFYNPSEKNSRRYISIFSYIMTLKNGEKIELEYDGIKYVYTVIDKVEVKPDDMYILEQKYDGKYLKLITCVPEGTYLRRGVVIAQLEQLQ
jgi:sortase A